MFRAEPGKIAAFVYNILINGYSLAFGGRASISRLQCINNDWCKQLLMFQRFPDDIKSLTVLINESVHTNDDVDLGDVEAVNSNFIVVKRGFVNVHRYYIPLTAVEVWDGHILWLKIDESKVKEYERSDIIPDPERYYVKDCIYSNDNYPPLAVIKNIWDPALYRKMSHTVARPQYTYKCDLCGLLSLKPEDLTQHISEKHC
jgi:hypothetical protein